ncbi:MAG: hypothetical protein ACK53L_21325, partial [Pirellulaceae bacterium]
MIRLIPSTFLATPRLDPWVRRPRRMHGPLIASLILAALGGGHPPLWAEEAEVPWPQFRGPQGDGHAAIGGLPVEFNEQSHVVWKVAVPGKAWSSPVVWGKQVWMTNANEEGTQLSVVVVDASSGKVLRDEILFHIAEPQFCHKFNSYASPTPVLEEGRAYVTFGSPGT